MKRLFGRRVPPPSLAAAAAAKHQRRWTKNFPLGDDMDFGVQPPAYGMQDNPFFATARPTQEGTLPPLKKTMHKAAPARPGSGAHHAGSIQVPDRLRDSMSYFAADGRRFAPDENQGHSKMQRDSMLRNVMTSHSNMYTHASIDKVKIALEAARRKKHDADEWRTLWTLLRTKHFCVELVKEPTDEMPEGDRLYVDLDTCQERRRPYVWRLDNGTTVVPVFSLEEYVFQYFSRNHVFESEWFPVPRNGTAFESFKKLEFPVLGHGGIHRMAALATMSTPHQFLLCLNPIQPACKFLTYPEMVHISKAAAESKVKHEAATTNMSKIF